MFQNWKFLLAFFLLFLISCGRDDAKKSNTAPPPPQVTVQLPTQRELIDYQEFTGRIEATETAEVRVRVKGFLQRIYFKDGAEVNKGDLLYEIDPRTFQAEVTRAEGEVKQRQAQLQLAVSEVARVEAVRGTVGAVTEEQYTQRVAAREAAKAALQQSQAALESARLELSFTKITAPISGRISRTLVTEGNLVGVNEPTLLTNIVAMDPVYVYFEVAERIFLDYQRMIRQEGAAPAETKSVPVFVALGNEEQFPHQGVIDFRDNRIDESTGTALLRGVIPNPDRVLVPGSFARVRVPNGKPKMRLLVPQEAVQSDQRGQFLLIATDDGTVTQRYVTTGNVENGQIDVATGLHENDRVIVSGIQRARPGGKVQPVTAQAQAANAPAQNQPPAGTGATPPQFAPVPPTTSSPSGTSNQG